MNTYPHMCRDGHAEIGHSVSGFEPEELACPVCRALSQRDRLRARVASLESTIRTVLSWKLAADVREKLEQGMKGEPT